MIMTILEAEVEPDNWAVLEETFRAASSTLPPPITQTNLVQSEAKPTIWRIITYWRSAKLLEDYRKTVETPGGVLMFRAAGAEPKLSIFNIVGQAFGEMIED